MTNEASLSHPALMVQPKAVGEKSGDGILPALFTDHFVSLMAGEQRVIQIQVQHADTRGEKPTIVVRGFDANTKWMPKPTATNFTSLHNSNLSNS